MIKIYCDICGKELKEEAEGEGEDAGNLEMGWGIWGEKARSIPFDFDSLCQECYESLKEAIKSHIEFLRKTKEEVSDVG